MKRILALLITTAALTTSLSAGLTYDFRSVSEGAGAAQLSGRAAIEGDNLRMDVVKGDGIIFKDNSVVLSEDGGETLMVLDPKKKTYYELPISDLLAASGSMIKAMGGMIKLSIKNPKVSVREAGDGGAIEGYPTRKYIIDTSYDMALTIMGIKNQSSIQSTSEVWTTMKLGEERRMFLQERSFRTGIEELDEVMEAQAKALKGFPLKHVTKTVTTAKNGKTSTTRSTVTIANIKKKTVDAGQFKLPSGYKEAEMPAVMAQPR